MIIDYMKPWKTTSRKTILNHSKWLQVEEHTVELPDGRTITQWPWIISPDYVNVVVVDREGLFLCFRQTKYAVYGLTLAPAGGYLEPGEDPLATARRELQEEMGYSSDEWHHLASLPVDGNHGAGTAHLFLALNAVRSGTTTADDLEEQELVRLSRSDIERALRQGDIRVLSWATAFALALLHLNHHPPGTR